jgi:hypothetical protein
MQIDDNTVTLEVGNAAGRLKFFEPAKLAITQTDQFSTPVTAWRPDKKNRKYKNQFHLTAETITRAGRQRFISVLQVCKTGELDQLPQVTVRHDEAAVSVRVSDGRRGSIHWRQ